MIGIARGFSFRFAHEFDVQESVLQARTDDFNMVGQLKALFEGPRRDAPVEQVTGRLLVVRLLLAADCQRVLLRLD